MSSSPPYNIDTSSSRRRRRRLLRITPSPPPPPPPLYQQPSQEEEASTSRIISLSSNYDGIWPEPFVEALAIQLALHLTNSNAPRLSIAPALALLFQVCSTWRAISRSELLWQNLVRIVWNRTNLLHPTWQDQYIYHHRTARNFSIYRCSYNTIHPSDHPPFEGGPGPGDQLPLFCLRLALSYDHLAAGYSDGSVRLFYLPTRLHLRTVYPLLRDRLGLYSRAVSGIILDLVSDRVVFASRDGDIHVGSMLAGPGLARRACMGDVVNDGVLVDFAGCGRFWIGLYAGVPGRAFCVWDAVSEDLIFLGGSLTDPESVMGWHMLTELRPTEFLGRVRVLANGLAIGITSQRVLMLDLNEQVIVIGEDVPRRGIIVGSVDTDNNVFTMVNSRGLGSVRRSRTFQEVCRFMIGAHRDLGSMSIRGMIGCMNNMHVIVSVGGLISVWDAQNGEYLYSLRERLEEASAIVANDQYLVATSNNSIHIWDFGA